MYDLLLKAAKGGWKTSEFWLAVLALVLPYLDKLFTPANDAAVNGWASHLGAFGFLVVAAYALGRSYVKAHVATAAAAAATELHTTYGSASPGLITIPTPSAP